MRHVQEARGSEGKRPFVTSQGALSAGRQTAGLTLPLGVRRPVERKAKWNDGGHFQDDERDILQGFPH